jgi:shikimate dehydrogenase
VTISGHAKIAGVIGWPVSHSLSPAVHGFWIRELAVDGAYVPLAVRPEDFSMAVGALSRMGFRGANVTVPHKEKAFEISHDRDDAALATGAVNTLVFDGERIVGRNTDASGYLASLDDEGVGSLSGMHAVVIGAGGAARAICFALLSRGVQQISVVNRTAERSQLLATFFGKRVRSVEWRTLQELAGSVDLLVNATSLGMVGQAALEIDITSLRPGAVVSDIVYRPLETQLLRDAKKIGLKVVPGLGMLLHQARPGFSAWFGVEPKVTAELRQHLVSILEGRI